MSGYKPGGQGGMLTPDLAQSGGHPPARQTCLILIGKGQVVKHTAEFPSFFCRTAFPGRPDGLGRPSYRTNVLAGLIP